MNEISSLNKLATEINYYKGLTVQNIIEIGKRLNDAKEQVNHGEWGKWLEVNVDMDGAQASKFMRVAKEFPYLSMSTNLTISKAFELLYIPAEERQEFIETHNVEDMTTRELRDAIKRNKELEQQNAVYESRLEELSNTEPVIREIVKEVIPDDYMQIKSDLAKAKENSKYQSERAERIYQDNQRLIIENSKIKKSGNVDEFNTRLNTTAFTLSMRTKKYLEDVGGMVWITDYLSEMSNKDIEILDITINSIFGWVMSMKDKLEEHKNDKTQ